MLLVSLVLAILPLLGIGLMFYQDPAITVDNLFISLMLLAISGVFMLNVAFELKQLRSRRKLKTLPEPPKPGATKSEPAKSEPARALGAAAAVGEYGLGEGRRQRGIVRDVQFFEAPAGVPNKSIVTLQVNGDHSARLLAFEGDLRSALPVGKKVEISYRETRDAYDLQGVSYW